MAIDVNISGLNTVVDVTMAQTAPIDADSGQVIVIKDYNNLLNKPSINGVTLLGNKDSSDIGVADASHTHTTTDITDFPSLATVAVSGDYDDLANTPAIHNVPSGGNAGQVLAKNSNTDYDLKWVNQSGGGGGSSAFTAEFGTTTYSDVKDAYDDDAILICTVDDSGNQMVLQFVYFDAANEIFFFAFPTSDGWYWTQLSNADGWDDGQFYFASTDVATQLADGLMSALDKQKLDGLSKRNIWYGTCSTSASSSPKSITTASNDFSLTAGNMLVVLFSHTNSLSSVSLQVDGGASKSAYAMDGTSDISNRWGSNEVVSFVYDGTKFVMLEQGLASTTQYGITKLNNTVTSTSTSEAATANAVKSAYDHGGVTSVNGSTGAVTLTIPTDTSDLTNGAGYITGYTETDPIYLASAASGITATDITNWNGKSDFSGSYNDLTDKPTIPTVNNATLTIQKNGTNVQTFTANASSNKTANITVPTKVSDLTNDSGFISSYTETDPVFTASAAHGISASDISNWNGKSDFSGSYNDLSDKPTIPDAVSVTRYTTTGTNIADITIGNTTTQLYAPSGGGSGGTQVKLVRW